MTVLKKVKKIKILDKVRNKKKKKTIIKSFNFFYFKQFLSFKIFNLILVHFDQFGEKYNGRINHSVCWFPKKTVEKKIYTNNPFFHHQILFTYYHKVFPKSFKKQLKKKKKKKKEKL